MTDPQLSEEQIKQLEAEMAKLHVDDILLQTIVSLLNLGARKAGLVEQKPAGEGDESGAASEGPAADWEQVKLAVDGIRALLPLVDSRHADKLGTVRDSLSRLQMIYAQRAQQSAAGDGESTPSQQAPTEAGKQPPGSPSDSKARPAQKSGRLWVPGQK